MTTPPPPQAAPKTYVQGSAFGTGGKTHAVPANARPSASSRSTRVYGYKAVYKAVCGREVWQIDNSSRLRWALVPWDDEALIWGRCKSCVAHIERDQQNDAPKPASAPSRPTVVAVHDGGDGEWGVTSLSGGEPSHRAHPCATCPWRLDSPTEVFPPEVFRHSARTAYDLATQQFACHMSGSARPRTCAGFLLRGASDNLSVRMSREDFSDVHTTVKLYDSYRQMAEANGVDPDDPALRECRGERPVTYHPQGD